MSINETAQIVGRYDVPAWVMEKVNTFLPEKTTINPEYLADIYDPNLHLAEDSEVEVIFIHEGAAYKNTLGYFTYDFGSEGKIRIATRGLVFPNASYDLQAEEAKTSSDAGLRQGGGKLFRGDYTYLMDAAGRKITFPAGTHIGFFLVPDGWNGGTVDSWDENNPNLPFDNPNDNSSIGTQGVFTTIDYLNPEKVIEGGKYEQSSQHFVIFGIKNESKAFLKGDDFLLLCVEDTIRSQGDQDFNDCIFIVRAKGIDIHRYPGSGYDGDVADVHPGGSNIVGGGHPMSLTVIVSPETSDLTLSKDQIITDVVTVRIPKTEIAAKVDVYFLADTTGSMVNAIRAVKKGIPEILAGLSSLEADVQFGIGEYKDFFPEPDHGKHPYAFKHQQSITANTNAIRAAIDSWYTTVNPDTPEAQLYALDQIAQPPGGDIGWRADSMRIIVWFGDAAGHDPVSQTISNLSYDITEQSVTAKLVAEKITVLALSLGTVGLDEHPRQGVAKFWFEKGTPDGRPGQGTRITSATGGLLVKEVKIDTIVKTITDRVKAQVTTIGDVQLVARGDTAQFVHAIQLVDGRGPLPRGQEHEVFFNVSWTGTIPGASQPQVFSGFLDIVIGGQVVSTKTVKITIPEEEVVGEMIPPPSPWEPERPLRPLDVSGKWMLIHQMTGTYLESCVCRPDGQIQTSHQDPLPTDTLSHVWVLIKQADGSYLIQTADKSPYTQTLLYLEASATTETKTDGKFFPQLTQRSDSDLQLWLLTPVGTDPDAYTIVPKRFPKYALGIYGDNCTCQCVAPTRFWGGGPLLHHYWRLSWDTDVLGPRWDRGHSDTITEGTGG